MIFSKNKKIWFKVSFLVVMILLLFITPYFISNAEASGTSSIFLDASGMSIEDEPEVNTGGWWNPAAAAARWLITLVLQLIQAIAGFILALGMGLVDLTLSDKLYDQVFFTGASVDAINTGWGLVRDFVNMFFILILIFVAIATILRVNKFSDKKFIVYVVAAALLVNFSKPITMFIIDISNLAMSFFMSNIREGNASYSTALMNAQGMGETFKSDTENIVGMMVSWLVEIIFKAIMGCMLIALGLTLLVRLVALWVLIILSPLAFFAIALPGTAISAVKSNWVNKLTYWCFYGPIMLFFFWLALVLVSAVATNVALGSADLQLKGINTENFVIGALKVFIPYASCIYMLFYGFDLSKKMASQAGDGAVWGLGKLGTIAKGAAFVGTAGYGLGYGKAFMENQKTKLKENKEARMLSKRAQLAGGSQRRAHQQKLQKEQLKDWDENGTPSKDELENILKEKPTAKNIISNANFVGGAKNTTDQLIAKKRAAAMKLAEGGHLNMKDKDRSYERARALFAGNPEALNKFEGVAKKKNRQAMIEHEFLKDAGASVDQEVVNENTRLADAGAPIMDAVTESNFRLKKGKEFKQDVYNKHLAKMKLSDITEQSADFLEQKEVEKYLEDNIGEEGEGKRFNTKQIRKQAAEHVDEDKQKILKKFF